MTPLAVSWVEVELLAGPSGMGSGAPHEFRSVHGNGPPAARSPCERRVIAVRAYGTRAVRGTAALRRYPSDAETLMATPSSSGRAASGRRWMNSVEKFESS